MSDIKEQVTSGLGTVRQHIDELRVKAHLLKLEMRGKHGEVVQDLEKAYGVTKQKLAELGNATEETADDARASLKRSWESLRAKIHTATAPKGD